VKLKSKRVYPFWIFHSESFITCDNLCLNEILLKGLVN
jgi:hypothetical protein